MSGAAIYPSSEVGLLLKAEDQPGGEPREFDGGEFDSSRTALDRTIDRLVAAGATSTDRAQDLGFSCEWWPPD